MALGRWQKELIEKWLPTNDRYYLDAFYSDRYFNSRETGTGYPVFIRLTYLPTAENEGRWEIARCQSQSACERKVDEIDDYIQQQFEFRRKRLP